MTGIFEWLGRVVMLVLAGMITLSIIGAIASIPSGSIETRIGGEPSAWPQPRESRPLPPPPVPAQEADPQARPAPTGPIAAPQAPAKVVPAPTRPIEASQWLEAITYALLAIAGLLALALFLFFRALGYWRRSAEALEALAARR